MMMAVVLFCFVCIVLLFHIYVWMFVQYLCIFTNYGIMHFRLCRINRFCFLVRVRLSLFGIFLGYYEVRKKSKLVFVFLSECFELFVFAFILSSCNYLLNYVHMM